ncbi:nuclear receptor coactivator 5 [Cylas formicarius]|uniref:nuclear receptor coactivator 5 n=1 Tax=Cylas formicarius TaxID=197179 RepID=UPI002958663B|nr:nuclear receptor coactivator 5 [Cylas formicarius]
MYRTDKQFMKNPATAAQRIYIGNLPKTVVAEDLEVKFKRHGKILGLVVNGGFAFIQYEADYEAHAAIKAENGVMMQGRKIVVKQAFAPNQKTPPQYKFGPQQPQQLQAKMEPSGVFDKPPPPVQQPKPAALEKDPDPVDPKPKFQPPKREAEPQDEEMDVAPTIRPPPPQKFDDDDRGHKRGGRGNRGRGRNRSRDAFDHPKEHPFPDRPGFGPGFGGRGDYVDKYGPPHSLDVAPPPERNDCEIIVVSRALTEYAEFIESKLKQLGLIVDLLFPNEDVPIGRVLANISSRGCLYAMLVMPQNEEHRSLTLNILHGIPQEHRNMPVEDALLLVSRNFEAYMRGDTLQPEDPNKMSITDRHPVPIQMMFNLLAENRMLTTAQYDRLLKYLQERRDLQHEHEVAEGVVQESDDSNSKQAELQNRILNILNKSSEPIIPTSITAPEPEGVSAPTPLLKDPSVQKALDSLLTGDMFKSIAGAI